jgi:hypothetical protein
LDATRGNGIVRGINIALIAFMTSFSPVRALLALLISCFLGTAYADENSNIRYENGKGTIPIIPYTPSVIIDSDRKVIITGRAAEIAVSGQPIVLQRRQTRKKTRNSGPKEKRRSRTTGHSNQVSQQQSPSTVSLDPVADEKILMIKRHRKIIAGMYPLAPGTYGFSRHALRDNPEFAEILADYNVFEFSRPDTGATLDVLLAVEKTQPLGAVLGRDNLGFVLKDRPEFAREIRLGENFRSNNYSSQFINNRDEQTEELSEGRISSVEKTLDPNEVPFLDAFLNFDTGHGSSGGVIFLPERSGWRIGGVISCYVPPKALQATGLLTTPVIKIVTIVAMKAAHLYKVDDLRPIVLEHPEVNDNCIKYDNRGGGD